MTKQASQYRTLWLSDIHLGSRSCQANALLAFLDHVEAKRIYLVGDVVDLISLKRSLYWPGSHARVVQRFLQLRRAGTEVIYIPGNHDDTFRDFAGSMFDGVPVHRKMIHETADQRRLLVVHGDEMDAEMRCGPWMRLLGSVSYCLLMNLNRNICRVRTALGMPYWSLAAKVKKRVGSAVEYMDRFEKGMAELAKREGLDGVICGHIHHAALKQVDGVLYCNDGDWVESCTALAESHDGQLQLLRWEDIERELADEPVAIPLPRRAA